MPVRAGHIVHQSDKGARKRAKIRLDALLVERGWFPSRESARRAIMAGLVTRSTSGEVLDKAGTFIRPDEPVVVAQPEHAYVSRGGLKLQRALDCFGIDMTGRIVLDVGASTGGFTDCALQRGAARVYAVDVGYGQLAWKLRTDDRVVVMERMNFRHVPVDSFQPAPDMAVMDVSFISIRLLLPNLMAIVGPPVEIVALIKPQFEAGREHVGKGGIVRDPVVHARVLTQVLGEAAALGLDCAGLTYSPISGGDGNVEFLAWFQRGQAPRDGEPNSAAHSLPPIRDIVLEAWSVLRGEDVSTQLS